VVLHAASVLVAVSRATIFCRAMLSIVAAS
jgi:hypothetical protein